MGTRVFFVTFCEKKARSRVGLSPLEWDDVRLWNSTHPTWNRLFFWQNFTWGGL